MDAFIPDPKTAASRPDGGSELSVNWEDDGSVLAVTQQQSNAVHGVARVLLDEIRRINKSANAPDALLPERSKDDIGRHHGNIVYRKGLTPRVVKMIANTLALDCVLIPPPK